MGVNEGLQRRRRAPRDLIQKQRVSEPAERQIELIASRNRNAVLLQRLPAGVDLAELLRTRCPDPAISSRRVIGSPQRSPQLQAFAAKSSGMAGFSSHRVPPTHASAL